MSWRRISRPEALPQGLQAARGEAAARLADWFTGGQSRGELGSRLDFLTGRAERSLADQIADAGGVKAVAAATGAAERTVRDWRAGAHSPSSQRRDQIARAARKATVDALGGTKGVANLSGRSRRTVQSWIRRPTRAGGDAAHRLNVHEVKDRHSRARATFGHPAGAPLYIHATGHVRVSAGGPSPSYEVDRDIHAQISQDAQEAIADAEARGDHAAAQAIIERELTEAANLGAGLYDGAGRGFFLDRVDATSMYSGPRGQ